MHNEYTLGYCILIQYRETAMDTERRFEKMKLENERDQLLREQKYTDRNIPPPNKQIEDYLKQVVLCEGF